MPQGSATEVTRKWFDQLESVLHAEAELAGLLGHGTMVGNAREFLVSRVLKSVLAPSLHIGTGKIIGHDGSESKQIDVIIYDPSFPVLEVQPGHGLYFAEGVVATIEVKSKIDKSKLHDSLDNCVSVTSMPPSIMTRAVTMKLPEMTPNRVADYPTFLPCSYIFAYQSRTSNIETFSSHVNEWWENRSFTEKTIPMMPEIIVAGRIVGLSNGRWFKVAAEGDLAEKIRVSSGDNAKIVMGFWEVDHPFGWLLMHLLITCAQRFSDSHKLALDKYLPVAEYWLAEMEGKLTSIVSTDSNKDTETNSGE